MKFSLATIFAIAVACGSVNGAVIRGSGATSPSVTSAAANGTATGSVVAQDRGMIGDIFGSAVESVASAVGEGVNALSKAVGAGSVLPTATRRKACKAALKSVELRESCDEQAGISSDTDGFSIKGMCEDAGCCFGLSGAGDHDDLVDWYNADVPACFYPDDA